MEMESIDTNPKQRVRCAEKNEGTPPAIWQSTAIPRGPRAFGCSFLHYDYDYDYDNVVAFG
jgi:hypothetical protein